MSILITGGTGFLGSFVAKELLKSGENIILYDVAPRYTYIKPEVDEVKVVKGSVTDFDYLKRIMEKQDVEYVVHTATLLTLQSQKDPVNAYKVNIGGTVNVLEASRIMDVKRVVFTSSGAVYGETNMEPVDEKYPKSPLSVYAATKLACEVYGLNYYENYRLDFVALRFPSIYGKIENPRIIDEIVLKPFLGYVAKFPRNPLKYDPLYVKDASKSVKLALFTKNLKNRIFNIGSGNFLSLREIIEVVKRLIPNARFETDPNLYIESTLRGPLNFDLAKKELKYRPSYSIERGVADFLNRLRSFFNIKNPKCLLNGSLVLDF